MMTRSRAREAIAPEAFNARIERILREADEERAERYRSLGTSRSPGSQRRQRTRQPDSLARAPHHEAWTRWTEAARKFKGPGKEVRARAELRNIRFTRDGIQVHFHRNGEYALTKHFAGFSEESLEAAKIFRDEAAKRLPPTRRCAIPAKVLNALGLDTAVDGVSRCEQRSCYRVCYSAPDGRKTQRGFYYRRIREEEAYAAAIAFREELLRNGTIRPLIAAD